MTSARRPGRPKALALAPDSGSASTRRALLDAAGAELIARDGQLEMAAVADRAAVSIGLAYHYFGSKAGLLAAVVDDFYDRYDAAVINLNPMPGADWGGREQARVARLVSFLYRDALAPVVLTQLAKEPEIAAVEVQRLARHIDLGIRNVRLAQEKGQIPAMLDPQIVVAMMMGGLRQAVGQALAQTPRPNAEDLVAALWDCVAALARFHPARHLRKEI